MLEPQDPRTKPPVTEWDCSTCKVPSFIVFSSHPSRFHLQNREGGSDVFPVCAGHQVITHKTLRDPCCHTLDSPPPRDDLEPRRSRSPKKLRCDRCLLWGPPQKICSGNQCTRAYESHIGCELNARKFICARFMWQKQFDKNPYRL